MSIILWLFSDLAFSTVDIKKLLLKINFDLIVFLLCIG